MKRFILIPVILAVAVSCKDAAGETSSLESTAGRLVIAAVPSPEPVSFMVTGTKSWGATLVDTEGAVPDWLSISPDECVNLSGRPLSVEVSVDAGFNPDRKLREAMIRITSEDCTLEIPVVQEKAGAYFQIDTDGSILAPGPMDTEALIVFATNDDWTASVEGQWTGISLEKTAGTAEDKSLKISFPAHSWDCHGEETARIVFSFGDARTAEVSLSRNRGFTSSMHFEVSRSDAWMPELTTALKQKMTGVYTHRESGVPVEFHTAGPSGICMFDSTSLCLDTDGKTTSWIEVACPEDLHIASFHAFCNNTANKYMSVCADVRENGTPGMMIGERTKFNNSGVTWGSEKTPWTVTPSDGMSVSLYASKQKNIKITLLEIVYE